MRILYTGFKGESNSSYQLLSQISGEKLYLTNSFVGLKKDIDDNSGTYDLVVMFGLDKTLKNSVRIETVAEYNGLGKTTKVNVEKIIQCMDENELKCLVSCVPTKYLCNAAYFYMLQKSEGKAIFIHIPSLKNMPEDMLEKLSDCMVDITGDYSG